MEQRHRKTRKVYDQEGDAHFLTFSCFRRLPVLSKERTRQWMMDAIDLSRQKNPFDLWARVIMPEHVHLVLLPHPNTKIASTLTTMKQSVSRRAMIWLKQHAPDYMDHLLDIQPNGKRSHRFWQRGGGYDRNLRSTRDVHGKINCVHQNPINRGLVNVAEQWKWSSASSWKNDVNEPILIDRESVPALSILDDDVDSKLMD